MRSGFPYAARGRELVFPTPALILPIPQCSRPRSQLSLSSAGLGAVVPWRAAPQALFARGQLLLGIDRRLRNHYLSFHGSVQLGPFSTQPLLCLVLDIFKTSTSLSSLIEIGW